MFRRTLCPILLIALACAPLAVRAEGTAYAAAAEAMSDGDWDTAYALALPDGAVATDLVTWTRLRDGAGTFPDYMVFLAAHPDWPGLDRLRNRAERAIPEDADPIEVLAFFAEVPPDTGEGVVRLAAALTAAGEAERAEAAVIDAWLTLGLDNAGHAALLAAHGDLLAPYHPARTEAMLWRWRTSDASRLLALIPEPERLLAEARIALIRGNRDAPQRIAAVPEDLRNHPGLAYDRFNRLADQGDYSDAMLLIKQQTGSVEALGQPFRWASWRATLARWAMREGRPSEAYDVAVQHHLTEGRYYADLEWLAGFLALTDLEDPEGALTHFRNVETAVEGPISLSRALYWQGRALEELGQNAEAQEAFRRGGVYQTAFYGLLAAERAGIPLDPALAGEPLPAPDGAAFLASDLGQAAGILLDADERGAAVLFVARLAQTLDEAGLRQLGAWLIARDEPFLTVLVGKTAVGRGIVIPSLYFPLHPLAEMDLPVTPELALSIARRESEFNFTVGSPVGALGLMQLMPATAREVAGELDLPFSRARLTADWQYNATLGSRYLANLQETFGDSPVMIAAGYNAGPSRPRTWMTLRGDPRKGEADVIDWIEHIPFTETRNYVMRVTESIPVYRARLRGEVGPLDFTALLNGAPPLVRPVARPAADRVAAVEAQAAEDVLPTAVPVGEGSAIRPVSRPSN